LDDTAYAEGESEGVPDLPSLQTRGVLLQLLAAPVRDCCAQLAVRVPQSDVDRKLTALVTTFRCGGGELGAPGGGVGCWREARSWSWGVRQTAVRALTAVRGSVFARPPGHLVYRMRPGAPPCHLSLPPLLLLLLLSLYGTLAF
jgi:hypothetical protein